MDLTDEQRKWVRSNLRQSQPGASPSKVDRLAVAICQSVLAFRGDAQVTRPTRQGHDQLRTLWKLITQADPPIGLIRKRLKCLLAPPRTYVDQRATRLRPDLFPSPGDFIDWTQRAKAFDLLPVARLVIAEGAQLVEGRRRANGTRSPPSLEPVIMGVARGTNSSVSDGGRPRAAADALVMYLAIDWAQATGAPPKPGRSGNEPFGELVHQVFSWLDQPAADQALRRFWEAVRREAARPELNSDA